MTPADATGSASWLITGIDHDPEAPETLTVSALMSCYAKEKPAHLAASLESLFAQTVRPDSIVLVLDGPVGEELEEVVARYVSDPRVELVVVRLAKNGGLPGALNAGLAHCRGTYTLRMDSDDICEPDRLAIQLAYARAHPDVDLISSWCEEFFDDGTPSRIKSSPSTHGAVARALRWRNVIVHPTTFMRTRMLRDIGGYRTRYLTLEDWDLFIRFVLAGGRLHVIPKSLLRFRTGLSLSRRRGGFTYMMDEIRFRSEYRRAGFLSWPEFLLTSTMYGVFRLIPASVRMRLYSLVRVSKPAGQSDKNVPPVTAANVAELGAPTVSSDVSCPAPGAANVTLPRSDRLSRWYSARARATSAANHFIRRTRGL